MTSIKLWSDLHLEFSEGRYDHIADNSLSQKDVILLLAGDISTGTDAKDFVIDMCDRFKAVILVCGNHEFYGHDFDKVLSEWESISVNGPDNFHFLNNETVIIDNTRFIGGTMWTDFNDDNPIVVNSARFSMNDYSIIKRNQRKLTPESVLEEHDKFKDFLIAEFDKPFDGKTVVVTHHSPGDVSRSLVTRDETSHCYFAGLEELITWHDKVTLWVHGHTHQSYDYMVSNTRVVSNPYGYHECGTNPDFKADIVINL